MDGLLDRVHNGRVVLVSGPAGSGKTVLVSSWARRRTGPDTVAWVDCSWLSDTPAAFWEATVSALAGIHDVGDMPMPDRTDPSPGDRRDLLHSLISWLSVLPDGQVIVWDDFHHVASRTTQSDVQYLIDRLPPTIGLILATRSVPQLALHRALVEGRLAEVRAADLAFTPEETARLVSRNGIGLRADQISSLERATNGWAAGLRLALISMARSDDPASVIDRLASSSEAVSGYLTEQVLSQLDAVDRDFLYDTCAMNTLTGPLVEALTQRDHGLSELRRVADQVGFLTRVSDVDDSYRYHPMFAEILRSQLKLDDPDRLVAARQRAATWLYEHGETLAALQQAVSGQAWDAVCRMAALYVVDLVGAGQLAQLAEIVAGLPAAIRAGDPRAQLVEAFLATLSDQGSRAGEALERAAEAFSATGGPDNRRFAIVGRIATALLGRYRGDVPGILVALPTDEPDLPPAGRPASYPVDAGLRASWWGHQAAALLWNDELLDATRQAERARDAARDAAMHWQEIGAIGVLAVTAAVSGDLVVADGRVSEFARATIMRRWSAAPYLALADIAQAWRAVERLDLVDADVALQAAEKRWAQLAAGFPGYFLPLLQARRALAAQDVPEAQKCLDVAASRAQSIRSPLLSRIHREVSAHVALADGDPSTAAVLARESSDALREYVSARNGADLAAGSGSNLVPQAERALAGDTGLTLRTLLSVAAIRHRAGDAAVADALLERALDITATHGFRLPFAEQAESIRPVLLDARISALRHASLLAELLGLTAPRQHGPLPYYMRSLTDRELEVLRHLAAHATISDIADELYLSRNTIRTHVKSIYRKLSANNRREALLRSVEFGIL